MSLCMSSNQKATCFWVSLYLLFRVSLLISAPLCADPPLGQCGTFHLSSPWPDWVLTRWSVVNKWWADLFTDTYKGFKTFPGCRMPCPQAFSIHSAAFLWTGLMNPQRWESDLDIQTRPANNIELSGDVELLRDVETINFFCMTADVTAYKCALGNFIFTSFAQFDQNSKTLQLLEINDFFYFAFQNKFLILNTLHKATYQTYQNFVIL